MFYLVIFIFIIILLIKFRHTKIKWKTFFRKGFAPKRGKFGVYCYCGKQGSGKTYSAVEFLNNNQSVPIYSNVHLEGIEYTYFSGFNELLELREKLNKPIIYYTYDLDQYCGVGGRGLYYPFNEYVYGRVARNTEELTNALANPEMMLEKREAFRHKFMEECDGHSTEKTFHWIFEESKL